MSATSLAGQFQKAADAIREADALLIGAGAGMGVDSGLPDFRGDAGFWKAYPPFRGRSFSDLSTPHWFRSDPALAWGFFGHRYNLYSSTTPHDGFGILRRWAERPPLGCFIFTSNVDGHFQRAGFSPDQVLECHGSIHFLQCVARCSRAIWPAEGLNIQIDEATIRTNSPLPRCPRCRELARPNILMFGDWEWLHNRHDEQQARYDDWLRQAEGKRVVAIEMGAGLVIPTVRWECQRRGQVLIRINPREADVPEGGISLPVGALAALLRIDEILRSPG